MADSNDARGYAHPQPEETLVAVLRKKTAILTQEPTVLVINPNNGVIAFMVYDGSYESGVPPRLYLERAVQLTYTPIYAERSAFNKGELSALLRERKLDFMVDAGYKVATISPEEYRELIGMAARKEFVELFLRLPIITKTTAPFEYSPAVPKEKTTRDTDAVVDEMLREWVMG